MDNSVAEQINKLWKSLRVSSAQREQDSICSCLAHHSVFPPGNLLALSNSRLIMLSMITYIMNGCGKQVFRLLEILSNLYQIQRENLYER